MCSSMIEVGHWMPAYIWWKQSLHRKKLETKGYLEDENKSYKGVMQNGNKDP